jgi:hypothetical protein
MLGPSVFWMHKGFILEFDMCGEKLRVKTFPISRLIWQKMLMMQSCVASNKEENENFIIIRLNV